MKKERLRVGEAIGTGVSVIVIVVVALFLVADAAGVKSYIVMSGSMQPTILTGSLCFVNTNAAYGDVEKGDIIAFSANGAAVAHRAISITEQGIEIKGDANDVSDGISTTEDNYLGNIVCWIPYAGYIIESPLIRYVVISIVGAVIVVMVIRGFRGHRNQKSEENVVC